MRPSELGSRVLGKEQIRAFEELKKVNVAGAQRMRGGEGGWDPPGTSPPNVGVRASSEGQWPSTLLLLAAGDTTGVRVWWAMMTTCV